MILGERDRGRFVLVWAQLLHLANEREKILPWFEPTIDPGSFTQEDLAKLGRALWADNSILKLVARRNPFGLSDANIALVKSWEKRISGELCLWKNLSGFSVFITRSGRKRAYGAVGVFQPLQEVIPLQYEPRLVRATLLPFEKKIVWSPEIGPIDQRLSSDEYWALDDIYYRQGNAPGVIRNMALASAVRLSSSSSPRTTWVIDSGGVDVPPDVQRATEARIREVAEKEFAGRYTRLVIRFHRHFCYIDAYTPPPQYSSWPDDHWETYAEFQERMSNTVTHLCRLRYHGPGDNWEFAFFAYSSETYKPSYFPNGQWTGRAEDAFRPSAEVYL